MKRIIIPEIEFRKSSIRDVVDFLIKAALTNDPDKKGVNIILLGSAEAGCTNTEEFINDVTLSARYISLYNALKIATSVTGLKCRIKDSAVVVMDRNDPGGEPIIMRMYPVEPAFGDGTKYNCSPSDNVNLKSQFEMMGVSFPRGSSINYNPGIGKVIVANTAENLQKVENLLNELNVIPMQVQITAQFVRLESTNIPHVSLGGSGNDAILGLCTNGTARLIAAPTVIMSSGESSVVKGVTEVVYPTQYEYNSGVDDTNRTQKFEGAALPSDFSLREVGVIMEVTPEISPTSDSVRLSLNVNNIEDPVWKDFGSNLKTGDGRKHVPVEQPSFHCNSFLSKLTVKDGHSVLAFGGVPTRDGTAFVYCVITVRIVGTDGKPIKVDEKPFQSDLTNW